MSSAAYITHGPDTMGIPLDDWQVFCAMNDITHSPQTVGGNVFYAGDVEITYGKSVDDNPARELVISTFYMGKAMPRVAMIAKAMWQRWGGSIECDEEILRLI